MTDPDESGGAGDPGEVHHRTIEPDPDDPLLELLGHVADLDGCDVEDLPPLYDRVDHLVEGVFKTPPPEEANVELDFTYHDYRIELAQSGDVRLTRRAETNDGSA